jgi:uncharacterized membrane protein
MKTTISTTWIVVLAFLAIWDLVWRGMALWRAGKRNQPVWFVALLVVSSVGLLPIIYSLITKEDLHEQTNQTQPVEE